MSNQRQGLLTLNAGSSSIKFAVFTVPELKQLLIGQIDSIGSIAAFKAKSSDALINEKYEWSQQDAPQNHADGQSQDLRGGPSCGSWWSIL